MRGKLWEAYKNFYVNILLERKQPKHIYSKESISTLRKNLPMEQSFPVKPGQFPHV